MARCLPPSAQGQQSSATRTQSLSVLQSSVEAGALRACLAWARNETPNEATPSAAKVTKIRKREETRCDMRGVYRCVVVRPDADRTQIASSRRRARSVGGARGAQAGGHRDDLRRDPFQ